MLYIISFSALLCVILIAALTADKAAAPWNAPRLPTDLLPRTYAIHLMPQGLDEGPPPANASFRGRMALTLDVAVETDTIILHAAGLLVSQVQVRSRS